MVLLSSIQRHEEFGTQYEFTNGHSVNEHRYLFELYKYIYAGTMLLAIGWMNPSVKAATGIFYVDNGIDSI